ncbi:MAG: iron-sulfur cluster assembly protein [Verrucomicrobiales bacterium]
MEHASTVTTNRALTAIRIPSGDPFDLPAGAELVITQSLGGSFTVLIPSQAGLFRVHGSDADALGLSIDTHEAEAQKGSLEDQVWAQLKTVFDPEIPVNIVDLGLVYRMEIKPGEQGDRVEVDMTLTAPGCGMGPSIAQDAKMKIESIPSITEANVDVVWEPLWSAELISAAGREILGMQ